MNESLRAFLFQVGRELNLPEFLRPGAPSAQVPEALSELYALSDGLDLPFASIWEAKRIEVFPDVIVFGQAVAMVPESRYACMLKPQVMPLGTCDRGGETRSFEPLFRNVTELLAAEYRDFLDDELREAEVVVVSIPEATNRIAVAAELKDIHPLVTRELLKTLQLLPVRIEASPANKAIQVVRKLHALGVECHLQNVRSEP